MELRPDPLAKGHAFENMRLEAYLRLRSAEILPGAAQCTASCGCRHRRRGYPEHHIGHKQVTLHDRSEGSTLGSCHDMIEVE